MDGVTGLSRILGSDRVNERNSSQNKQQQADAFHEAMQQHSDGTATEPEPEPPVRRRLQPNDQDGRNLEGEAHHVDVVA
jgi:hypothetical protein